jgi:CBS domain-containing protein
MLTARDVMTHPPITIEFNDSIGDAARLMAEHGVGFLPVVEDDMLAGVVTDRDLVLRVLARDLRPSMTSAGSIATVAPVTVEPETPIDVLEQLIEDRRVRRLVVAHRGHVLGVVSQSDLARVSPYASPHVLTRAMVPAAARSVRASPRKTVAGLRSTRGPA